MFAADELILAAGEELPKYEEYEDFPQIENGSVFCACLNTNFLKNWPNSGPLKKRFAFDAAGGMLAHTFMKLLYFKLGRYGVDCELHAIRNDYFGPTITVGGLITGQDLLAQLKGRLKTKFLLLPHNMLREREDVFLDGITTEELAKSLGVRVVPVRGGGDDWIRAIFELAENCGR